MISRWMRLGAIVCGSLGTLFALAVVSFADCSGPNCNRERILGVLGHAGAGAAIGALLGGIAAMVRRSVRR